MGRGIANFLFDLSGDVLSALGSFFGLGSIIDDNIFRDDVARAQANKYRARLSSKLMQLKERNSAEYHRIMNAIGSLSRTNALDADSLRKALAKVKDKASTALNKDNNLMVKVESEIAGVESDLMSVNTSRRRKYIPQTYKASYWPGDKYTPFKGYNYSTKIEEQIDKEIGK